ncbi:claudin-14-like [Conger conger]|uniref:claudin-14-like n=1 Tax=Conger conger TaxID=82655 RepID=UPI002A5B0DDD|nr:claudin-14-like [Conger conger]
MGNKVIQILGFFLGLLGLLGTTVAMVMPHWRRSVSVGSSALTDTAYMKGLWMECVWHSTGIYLCEIHRSLLDLPRDLQAARALMVLSCLASMLAAALSTVGMDCTSCARGSPAKTALAAAGGACYIVAGLLCLVTSSWTTNDIIRDFPSHLLPGGVRYEIGQAVYVGFVSAAFSVAGGVVLCLSCGKSPKYFLCRNETHDALQLLPIKYQPPVAETGNDNPAGLSTSTSEYKLNDLSVSRDGQAPLSERYNSLNLQPPIFENCGPVTQTKIVLE